MTDDITAGIDAGIDQVTDAGAGQPVVLDPAAEELQAVARWITTQMDLVIATANVPGLIVSEDEVPLQGDPDVPRPPCIVFSFRRAKPTIGNAAARLFTFSEWAVKIVDQSETMTTMAAVRQAIFANLNQRTGTVPGGGWWIGGGYEVGMIRYVERPNDTIRYNHQGGVYRIMHCALPG